MDIKFINNLNSEVINYFNKKEFKKLSEVQIETIPLLLKNKSCFVSAPTGTGKTFSFLFPIFSKLNYNEKQIQSLIIVPTNELAIQINNVINDFKKITEKKITSTLAIGRGSFDEQIKKISKGSQIIIGTPDRIISIYEKNKFNLNNLKFFILDEVDMLLDFGSFKKILPLIDILPKNTTFSFFSASFSIEIQNYLKRIFSKFNIEIKNIIINRNENKLNSYLIKTRNDEKIETLIKLLNSDKINPYFALIFSKSNEEVEYVFNKLKAKGFKKIGKFTSNLNHRERNRLFRSINNLEFVYLVTTDLMSRGIDFVGVSHIINYSLPIDLIYYQHRIGRTNRNSINLIKGDIYNIYDEQEKKRYHEIIKKNQQNVDFIKLNIKDF